MEIDNFIKSEEAKQIYIAIIVFKRIFIITQKRNEQKLLSSKT